MSHTNTKQMMLVISTEEDWISLKSLLQKSLMDNNLQVSFSSLGLNQVCDIQVHDCLVSLRFPNLKEDMTAEEISQALEDGFKTCTDGISTFLLLIQGGHFTKRERRLMQILEGHFGAEALKHLAVLSLEDGKIADILDDALLELISLCDGRYHRITSHVASESLHSLLEMVDCLTGYTNATLMEVKERNTEDSAVRMLRQKVQEAEQKQQGLLEQARQQEERRTREMEDLKVRHEEERQKEQAEKMQHEEKRENLEESVTSHRAMSTLKKASDGGDMKKLSVMLLGLSGSGKSSALNLILERAANQYSTNESSDGPPQPTMYCERKEVSAGGHRLVLVDTPELWDEDGLEDVELVKDCLALSLPGPHVYLLVLQVGRFTQGECNMLGELQKIFGRELPEFTVILFVQFDGNQKIEDYVSGAHPTLQDLVRKCGSRYYELNLMKSQNALSYPQVKDLLLGIIKLTASHGGRPHSSRRFSVQELQERRKGMKERREEALEGNYLLRDD